MSHEFALLVLLVFDSMHWSVSSFASSVVSRFIYLTMPSVNFWATCFTSLHPALDPSINFRCSVCRRFLHTVRCSGCLGSCKFTIFICCTWCSTDVNNFQVPIQLSEISPPAFRATFPGVAYQVGNVCFFGWLLHSHKNDLCFIDGILSIGADRNKWVASLS
jgi:hypothetical protein